METAVAALIIITLLLFGLLTMSEGMFNAQDEIFNTWREMDERLLERIRTDLTPVKAQTPILSGSTVSITLRNDGDTKLADFDQWDVILQYTAAGGIHTEWYPFDDKWTKDIDDVLEPGILNPGEEMVIEVSLSPWVATGTTNTALVVTPNGISVTAIFTH